MVLISFTVVRIGAIAFQITGLEWSLAKFQALSCFTGTGFTTKEAEFITSSPKRRQIASVLMVLGNAGLVALMATFANTIRPPAVLDKITIPYLHLVVPRTALPWMKLTIIIAFLYVVYKLFTRSWLVAKLTKFLRARMIKRKLIKPVSFEELIVATGGYGLSDIEITKDSPVLDKTIKDANLRKDDINILVVEREGTAVSNPPSDMQILLGDRLVCFGKLEKIREKLCVTSK
jgi:hypothetical protein